MFVFPLYSFASTVFVGTAWTPRDRWPVRSATIGVWGRTWGARWQCAGARPPIRPTMRCTTRPRSICRVRLVSTGFLRGRLPTGYRANLTPTFPQKVNEIVEILVFSEREGTLGMPLGFPIRVLPIQLSSCIGGYDGVPRMCTLTCRPKSYKIHTVNLWKNHMLASHPT